MTTKIAILSGKGGVGKTTTALNLALALKEFGREVIVVDGNLSAPNVGLHLGINFAKHNIHEILKGNSDVQRSLHFHPTGIKVIPGSLRIEDHDVEHERLSAVMLDLHGKCEAVLIDAAPGTGKDALHSIRSADHAIVVTTPELSSVIDAMRSLKLAEKEGKNILGAVVNRVKNNKTELSIKNIETMLGHPVICQIREEPNVPVSHYLKRPLVSTHPDSHATISFKKLAAHLIGEEYEVGLKKEKEPSFFNQIKEYFTR